MCEDLFTAVMSATDNDNRLLSAAFQLLPSKKVSVLILNGFFICYKAFFTNLINIIFFYFH